MAQASRYALYLLFALSGVCGLVYESIWSHYLRNYLGHAAHGLVTEVRDHEEAELAPSIAPTMGKPSTDPHDERAHDGEF